MTVKVATIEPITISIDEAVRVSSLCRRTLHTLISDGKIATRKVGRRRLVIVRSLRNYLENGDGQATGAW